MESGECAWISRTWTKHARRIASHCPKSTNSWILQPGTSDVHGCFFRVQPDKNGWRRLGENRFHHKPRTLLLQGNAFRTKECRSYLSDFGKQDVQQINRQKHGSICRWYARQEQRRACPPGRPKGNIHHPQTVPRWSWTLVSVFGVASGKFLGFMVSQRGIEANSEKV